MVVMKVLVTVACTLAALLLLVGSFIAGRVSAADGDKSCHEAATELSGVVLDMLDGDFERAERNYFRGRDTMQECASRHE
jgi:hypothetical protein